MLLEVSLHVFKPCQRLGLRCRGVAYRLFKPCQMLGLRCRGVAYKILGRDVAGHGAGPRGPKMQQRKGKGNTMVPKWSQNGSQNRSQNVPKMVSNGYQHGS